MQELSESDKISYHAYRQRFLQSAEKHKWQLNSTQLPQRGIFNEALFQDLAFIDNQSDTTIVHLSGVHGIEGYIGSDIQNELLKQKENLSTASNIALLHAVNPYGMSWYRRVNANNVDLNRNGIDFNNTNHNNKIEFESLQKCLDYKDIFFATLKLLPRMYKLGYERMLQIIAGGQYLNENYTFYGGQCRQTELVSLLFILKKTFPKTSRWIFIDVHTGLGPFAFDSLILCQTSEFWQKCLPLNHIVDLSTNKKIYRANGLIEDLVRRTFLSCQVEYLTQEFGTYNNIKIFSGLIFENNEFMQGLQKSKSRVNQMIESYYPNKNNWRNLCLQIGVQRFFQIEKPISSTKG